jgi:hypothetical protein
VPTTVTWASSTDNVGVSGYELWQSTDGGTFTKLGTVAAGTRSVSVPVAPGASARFRVRALDAAGNSAASAVSTPVTYAVDQENEATRVTTSGTWTTASDTASSGGATRHAATSASMLTYKPPVGTTQVALVLSTGPAAGYATVTVNGGTATTVDLYAATAGHRRLVLQTGALSATAQHTIVVKPAGTKNTSSTSTRIDIDAFVSRR